MNEEKRIELINNIFTPSAPTESLDLFVGRTEEINRIRQAIEEKGQHIVMYGNRGVGKTSITNMLADLFTNVVISKITCSSIDTYSTIWDKIVSKIHFVSTRQGLGFTAEPEKRVSELSLPEQDVIAPNDLIKVFTGIPNYVLVIIDEFDCIQDDETKKLFAETLKVFSDNLPNVTILLVGVADSVNELIGQHKSVERCIKQINVPLLSAEDINDLITNSFSILGMSISEDVIDKIVEYSMGYAHYAHLLCKYATLNAVENNQDVVELSNFDYAVEESILNSDYSIRDSYTKAVSSYRDKNKFEDVIFASILAETEESDDKVFTAEQVLAKYQQITQQEVRKENLYYNLGMLCKPERGVILKKVILNKNVRYKFHNPLMKAFVKLKLHNKV